MKIRGQKRHQDKLKKRICNSLIILNSETQEYMVLEVNDSPELHKFYLNNYPVYEEVANALTNKVLAQEKDIGYSK